MENPDSFSISKIVLPSVGASLFGKNGFEDFLKKLD